MEARFEWYMSLWKQDKIVFLLDMTLVFTLRTKAWISHVNQLLIRIRPYVYQSGLNPTPDRHQGGPTMMEGRCEDIKNKHVMIDGKLCQT